MLAPNLWDAVRDTVDNRSDVGLYILTGSTVVDKKKIKHSGNGRIAKMKMYPMSLWESKESSGEVSLREIFYNPDYSIDGARPSGARAPSEAVSSGNSQTRPSPLKEPFQKTATQKIRRFLYSQTISV